MSTILEARGRQTAGRPARSRRQAEDPLQAIPGIGPSMSEDLRELGIRRVEDLVGKDPQVLYETLRDLRGGYMDRCVLYVFRCAVYFASHRDHDPELLKWWNWKDGRPRSA